ncbi:S-adenosyl-L-methionine-dependent methyltransferase [Ramaria rubella]|nr:S-adenosyl-L-methionine-dependent methyltransferase [Ramaria rubella]
MRVISLRCLTLTYGTILFFDSRRKNFHARWFIHGSKTILEELSHGQELFLSIADGCQDISSDCIISKCKVKRISLDEHAREQWPAKDSYFYSSAWDRKHPAGFIEVTDEQVLVSPRTCQLCEAREAPLSTFKSSIRSTIRSREYHKYDFIRYEASSQLELTCSIGQIIGFICSEEAVKVQVHKLGRERERKGPGYFAERALFLTSVKETVEAISVIGTCQVIHISEYELKDCAWIENHPDCFYVQSQATSLDSPLTPLPSMNLKMCHSCYHEEEHMHELKVQCYSEQKLRAFDPFIGIGGFGLGLAEGCSMQTVFGVEIDPSAAETTRKNFPLDAVIITDDANRVLRDVAKGREHRLERGKIDFIYSGPPCQNDSTLNRHKTDQKRPVFTTLSFVDVIRPAFFIMESVPGFLQWKLHRDTYDIQAGELKLCLKYNVSSQIMHARSFGVPQTRDRFFIVATQPIWGQFQFPEPTHAFNEQQQPKGRNFRLGQGLKVSTNVARGRALHELVTVAETLSDLPQFDWKSPKKLTTEDKKRAERFLTVTCRSDGLWGIDDVDFQYVTPSVNAYQWRLRKNLILSTDISYQHYTKHLPMNQVENICDVPFSRGADYRHLNQEKRDWSLRGPTSAKAMAGFQGGAYTRLNPDGYFQTVVTNVGPVAKQSQILHPFCKRIITVREYARAQGFPDDFTFYSVTDNVDEYYRQIGNSIPFGVSAALGCSIQDLVFKNWLKKRRAVNEI